jgi:hypothetical protein
VNQGIQGSSIYLQRLLLHTTIKCFHRRVQQELSSKSSTVIRSLPINMEDRS